MLIPTLDAEHFLRVYIALLNCFAGRELKTVNEYASTRDLLFEGPARANPPTDDPDLLEALASASYGDFAVARHLPRYTEMVGPDGRAYLVKGISTEPKDLLQPWSMVRTAVMRFRGEWICDGLANDLRIRIGAGMKKEILERVRVGSSASAAETSAVGSQSYTEKQGQYLAFIHQYTKLNGQAPAEADMQRFFKVSPPSVHQMILTLEKRKLIERTPGQSRSIKLLISAERLPKL